MPAVCAVFLPEMYGYRSHKYEGVSFTTSPPSRRARQQFSLSLITAFPRLRPKTYPPTNTKIISDVDLCTVSFDATGLMKSYSFGLMVETVKVVEDLVRVVLPHSSEIPCVNHMVRAASSVVWNRIRSERVGRILRFQLGCVLYSALSHFSGLAMHLLIRMG